MNAILHYEEPIKPSDLENWSHEDEEHHRAQQPKKSDEVLEIKPKKFTGKCYFALWCKDL